MIKILTYAPAIGDGTSFYRLAGVMPYLEQEYDDIKVTDISNNKFIEGLTVPANVDELILYGPA